MVRGVVVVLVSFSIFSRRVVGHKSINFHPSIASASHSFNSRSLQSSSNSPSQPSSSSLPHALLPSDLQTASVPARP
ncbi:hypothetical protein E2C01_068067 [Portunus trituberculatus]|uniref:Secreted protein n=1 Tax=Portunus trituberculatus TaxID=210409 RepID=A0A5B7HMX3_PORTR|nr:hypothetical protein [Portunus trituberculatus]